MKKTLLFLMLLCLPFMALPQVYIWDVGGQLGMSNYFGDLANNTGSNSLDIFRPNTRFTAGAFARVRAHYRYAFNFQLNYILISGADSLAENTSRTRRNLHFRNNIIELTSRMEYYPLIFNDVGGHKRFRTDFHFYTFAGLGLLYNNPQAEYNGGWVSLRPLETEGSRYSAIQPVIPIGFGGFFTFKSCGSRIRRHRIGVEVNYRLVFTDYLDDVSNTYPDVSAVAEGDARDLYYRTWELSDSQSDPETRRYPQAGRIRGNSERNDSYTTILISYSYVLATNHRSFYRPKYNYIYGNSSKNRRKKF